jgi:hypothetical protein
MAVEANELDDLYPNNIANFLDWPKSELSSYVFGGNEPPGRLFTTSHRLVIIDSEQMFSTGPTSFESDPWLKKKDGERSESGCSVASEMCREIASLSQTTIATALQLPAHIKVNSRWPIAPKIRAAVKFAEAYGARDMR